MTQKQLKSALKSDVELLEKINDTIFASSGKQLRPILSLMAARACTPGEGLTIESYNYAAAAELLHNATLLHDDVADDSDKRRGKPTVYALFGSAASVLIGDFWLVKAMDLILGVEAENKKVLRLFSKTLSDLAEGEMLQLQKADTSDTTEADYLKIIYSKTASLFEASIVSGAYSVEAPEDYVEALRRYAISLGIAFQIKDDIFDYSTTRDVGKPLGVDILERKITMPLLGALENDKSRESEIRTKISRIAEDNLDLRDEIVAFVRNNGGQEYAKLRLEDYITDAVEALSVLPESKEKSYLLSLAEYVGDRLN